MFLIIIKSLKTSIKYLMHYVPSDTPSKSFPMQIKEKTDKVEDYWIFKTNYIGCEEA